MTIYLKNDYRLLVTKKGTFKLQLYRDSNWIIYKDSTGCEVECNSWIDTLQQTGYYNRSSSNHIHYEELSLSDEEEEILKQKANQVVMNENGCYIIGGWLNED